ncbi:hypothetical protein [Spartinivicinus poritis]|uniref:Uncharacterized protein n=1 Tax=Spartinivicinus poritis TaxID=2994640 RepID=A0ABT5UD14_9GAMM|nr:hypothetical protein [Spartinivicinus sp. A2-2]MDE1462959.1 hypothetical protein [Spartinivicinus sp. A2-2]
MNANSDTITNVINQYAQVLSDNTELVLSWQDIEDCGWRSPAHFLMDLLSYIETLSTDIDEHILDAIDRTAYVGLLELMIQLRNQIPGIRKKWEQFQSTFVDKLNSEQLPRSSILLFLGHLTEFDLPLNQQLVTACQNWHQQQAYHQQEHKAEATPETLMAELETLISDCNISNEYDFYLHFADNLTFVPEDTLIPLLADMLRSSSAIINEGCFLFLLHKRPEVRQTLLSLLQHPHCLEQVSSKILRRLIMMRNWLATEEQQQLDTIIRQIRRLGIDCEEYLDQPHFELKDLRVSMVDGSGACSLLALVKEHKKFRLIGMVLKEQFGIIDSWFTPLSFRKDCDEAFKQFRQQVFNFAVDKQCLNYVLPHFLAYNRANQQAVTAEVMMLFEMLNITQWQPAFIDSKTILAEWKQANPTQFEFNQVAEVLSKSNNWPNSEMTQFSWFESDNQLHKKIVQWENEQLTKEQQDQLPTFMLESYREKWLHRFVLLAIVSKHKQQKRGPEWHEFAILADCLASNMPFEEIPLFTQVLQASIDAYFDQAHHPHLHSIT